MAVLAVEAADSSVLPSPVFVRNVDGPLSIGEIPKFLPDDMTWLVTSETVSGTVKAAVRSMVTSESDGFAGSI